MNRGSSFRWTIDYVTLVEFPIFLELSFAGTTGITCASSSPSPPSNPASIFHLSLPGSVLCVDALLGLPPGLLCWLTSGWDRPLRDTSRGREVSWYSFLTSSRPWLQLSGSGFVLSRLQLLPSGPCSWFLLSLGSSIIVFVLCPSTWGSQVKVCCC